MPHEAKCTPLLNRDAIQQSFENCAVIFMVFTIVMIHYQQSMALEFILTLEQVLFGFLFVFFNDRLGLYPLYFSVELFHNGFSAVTNKRFLFL